MHLSWFRSDQILYWRGSTATKVRRATRPRHGGRHDAPPTPVAELCVLSTRNSANATSSSSSGARSDDPALATSRPSRARSPSSSYSETSNPRACAEEKSTRTRTIRSPAARERRIASVRSRTFSAPVIALRLASRASLSSAIVWSQRFAHQQVAEHASDHRRIRVAASVKLAHVVGECDLLIAWHTPVMPYLGDNTNLSYLRPEVGGRISGSPEIRFDAAASPGASCVGLRVASAADRQPAASPTQGTDRC